MRATKFIILRQSLDHVILMYSVYSRGEEICGGPWGLSDDVHAINLHSLSALPWGSEGCLPDAPLISGFLLGLTTGRVLEGESRRRWDAWIFIPPLSSVDLWFGQCLSSFLYLNHSSYQSIPFHRVLLNTLPSLCYFWTTSRNGCLLLLGSAGFIISWWVLYLAHSS